VNRLIAVFYFVLSLYGFDVGSTIVHRINVDGSQALHSKVVAQPGVARFECLRSASGRCYYTLYPRECASIDAAAGRASVRCPSGPVRHFAIANGDSREIAALPRFRLCVSTEDGTPGPDCEAPEPIAAR